MGMIKSATVKAADYGIFIMLLIDILEDSDIDVKEDVIFTQDNASIHQAKSLKVLEKSRELKFYFLPPYCPTLAPVETMFGIIKRKIKSQYIYGKLNFSKESGRKAIVEATNAIYIKIIQKLWIKFVEIAKTCIISNHV
jgi:transposase